MYPYGHLSPEIWHAQRLARCVIFIFSKNGCDLPPVKLYHLSCFGFGKNNSTHCALRFANPNAVLAILLSACLHFEGNAFVVRKAAAHCFCFSVLTFLLLRIECMAFAYHSPETIVFEPCRRSCGAKVLEKKT